MSLTVSLKDQLNIGAPHHAYLIVGERVGIIAELKAMLEDDSFVIKANADFHLYEHDAFLMEHAHELRRQQAMHASLGSRKIFVVAFNTIISEAQNALLKTLEEPTVGTKFFFITRTAEIMLPTVRSRMQVIRHQPLATSPQSLEKNSGEEFLKATIPERMKIIEKYTKVKVDQKAEAKESARVFLELLERALYQRIPTSLPIGSEVGISKKTAAALESVVTAKRYLSDRSPSVKLLLEHLALTIYTA